MIEDIEDELLELYYNCAAVVDNPSKHEWEEAENYYQIKKHLNKFFSDTLGKTL